MQRGGWFILVPDDPDTYLIQATGGLSVSDLLGRWLTADRRYRFGFVFTVAIET